MKLSIDDMARMWESGETQVALAAASGFTVGKISGIMSRNRDKFPKRADAANQRRAAFHAVNTQDEGESVPLPFLSAPVEPVLTPSEYDNMRRPHAKGLLELERDDCRWPMGEAPYVFCCAEAIQGQSYCQHHYSRSLGKGTHSERKAVADLKRIGRAA